MASLLDKIRIVTLGNFHQLLDAVIDLNSPAAVKQYIRDLEGGIIQIEHSANVLEGGIRTINDDLAGAQKAAARLDADITTLLTDEDPTNDRLALPMQTEFDAATAHVQELEDRRATQQKMLDQLNDAIAKLQAKHRSMLNTLEAIEAKVEAGQGMETVTNAVAQVSNLTVDAPSVDNLAARVNRKYNEQSAAFDRAMGKLSTATNNDVAVSQAEAALARRKAAIKDQKEAAAAAAGTATQTEGTEYTVTVKKG